MAAKRIFKGKVKGCFCLWVFCKGKNSKSFQVEEDTISNLMQLTSPVGRHQMLPGHFGHYLTSSLMTDNPSDKGYSWGVWEMPRTCWNEGRWVGYSHSGSHSGSSQPGRTGCLLELIIPCKEWGKKHNLAARRLHWEVHSGAHFTSAWAGLYSGHVSEGKELSAGIRGAWVLLLITYWLALWP